MLRAFFYLLDIFVFWHGSEEFHYHWQCDRSGNHIGDRLGYLDSGKAQDCVHDPEDGDEDQTASDHGQKSGTAAFSDTLEEHVSIKGEGHEKEGEALDAQGGNADGKDSRIVTEHAYNSGRAGDTDKGGNTHDYETAFYAEPESIPDAFVFSGTVVEGADWLEALSDAQCYTEEEVYDPCDNAHGCDSGISVGSSAAV